MRKKTRKPWGKQLCLTPVALTLLLSFSSNTIIAQESSGEVELEEIVVTGSHIRKKDTFNSSSPIGVVGSDVIEGTGSVNVGELLLRVPSITGDVTGSSVNVNSPQSSGVSTTALRNVGSSRTLVLLNGRRYVSGLSAGAGYGVDLNTIPTALIERVDVLTGGQSAAYGSDAVAGVVNIITKKDFEGIEFSAQTSRATGSGGDREKNDFSLTMGKNFDNANVWASFGYSDDAGLLSADRDFSRFSQRSIDTNSDGLFDTLAFEGSSFIPGTRLIGGGISIQGDGSPFNGGRDLATTDRLNFNEFRSLLIPLERKFAAAGLNFDLSERASTSVEVSYARVESRARFEPLPLSIVNDVFRVNRGGSTGIDITTHPLFAGSSAANQLINAGVTSLDDVLTFRRTVELGDRGSGNTRSTFRIAAAFDYDINDNLHLNVYGTYGVTDQVQTDFGDINLERAAQGLNIESDGRGGFRCADPVARINGCVPYNPFNTSDSVAGRAGIVSFSPEAVEYLSAAVGLVGEVEQFVLSSVLSGELPLSITDVGNVSFASGVEYRRETGSETPDGLRQRGITRGFNIQPTDGSFNVVDVFGELHVPIIEQLALDFAVRFGDYSSVGNTTTWKIGLDAPVANSVRLRAAISESVRAPNISDLFAGRTASAGLVSDPCAGVTAATGGNLGQNCRSIAAIANRVNNTGAFTLTQVESQNTSTFNSGSPDVEEETADSITAGIVITPTALPNLSIAIDYYDIEIEDAIRIPSGTTILDRCHNVTGSAFDPTCGGLVFRDPNNGPVLDINAVANNEDVIETSGIDLELAYYIDELGPGSLNMTFSANYLDKFDVTGLEGDVQDLKGEVLFPEFKFTSSLAYTIGKFDIFSQFRFWDSTVDRNDNTVHNDNLNNIASQFYVDLKLGYNFNDKMSVYIGANNLFDRQPPSLGFTHKYFQPGTNTNGTAFDITGRQIYAGLKAAF